MRQFIEYKKFFKGYIDCFADGTVCQTYPKLFYRESSRETMGKYALYQSGTHGTWSTDLQIRTETSSPIVSPGDTLFLSPKSLLPRDHVRNSGYKITIKMDNPDATVVVPPLKTIPSDRSASILASCKDALLLCDLEQDYITEDDNDVIDPDIMEKAIGLINDWCQVNYSANADIIATASKFKEYKTISFVPNVPEYKDILLDTYPGKQYTTDDDVPLVPNATVSVETLEIWKRLTNNNILETSILQSDATEYPLTMAMFLEQEHCCCKYGCSDKFKHFLTKIGFEDHYGRERLVVTPKDWNMLQKWLMHNLNVDENGGYIPTESLGALDRDYQPFVRRRYVVAPMYINAPAVVSDLQTLL